MGMGWIDITIIAIIALGGLRGFLKGFINQLASIAGLVVGFFAAKTLYLIVADKISVYVPDASMTTIQIVAFIAVWIVVPLLFSLIASFFTHAVEMLSLGAFNRFLGLLLGGVKWALIVGLFINVLDYVDAGDSFIDQTNKEESMLYYPVKDIVSSFFPAARDIANKYIIT